MFLHHCKIAYCNGKDNIDRHFSGYHLKKKKQSAKITDRHFSRYHLKNTKTKTKCPCLEDCGQWGTHLSASSAPSHHLSPIPAPPHPHPPPPPPLPCAGIPFQQACSQPSEPMCCLPCHTRVSSIRLPRGTVILLRTQAVSITPLKFSAIRPPYGW